MYGSMTSPRQTETIRVIADEAAAGQRLDYAGTVTDKDTGKPIAGAVVTVRRSLYGDPEVKPEYWLLQETRHTTDKDGKYHFTIPPERYGEQWAKVLQGSDREQIGEACRALGVLGREGREYLYQGLDSPNTEARRMCLATLTIADFKKKSDAGRQKLVKLAGDRDDMRIRERATQLLSQWRGSIPSP